MLHILTLLAGLLLCSAPLHAQTMKALMFNSTNGQVVANTGTNALKFTNSLNVGDVELTLSGLSFGAVPKIDLEQAALVDDANQAVLVWSSNSVYFQVPADWSGPDQKLSTRSNLGFPLAALTNTSNVTMMRALSGSTNTNHPYSGTVALTNTNAVLTFSNGILQSAQ